jgi:hypothetical protein
MRSHWRYRLAGLVSAIAVALAVGPAYLTNGLMSHSGAKAVAQDCPAGTHWDDILQACV